MEGNTLTHKRCSDCGDHKPATEFHTRGNTNPHLLKSECKSCSVKSTRKYRELNVEGRLLSSAKARAKRLGAPFNLTLEDIVIPEFCPVLGIPIVSKYAKRTGNSPSVDKAVPSLGYVKGNVVVISWRANRLKSDASVDELKRIASFYQQFVPQAGASHV